VAEAFDGPDGLDAGFRRHDLGDGAFPPGANFVAVVAGAIDALGRKFRRREGGVFGEFALFFEKR
jgi:hypothetical protein